MQSWSVTYGIGRGELLLGCDDGAGALGGVECGFALDDSLAGSGRAATSAATDLGDGVPFLSSRHCRGGLGGSCVGVGGGDADG